MEGTDETRKEMMDRWIAIGGHYHHAQLKVSYTEERTKTTKLSTL